MLNSSRKEKYKLKAICLVVRNSENGHTKWDGGGIIFGGKGIIELMVQFHN